MSHVDAHPAPPSRNAFGTFGGVFTPSILTILGVIMFMRTGFVVGEAGIWGALAILVLAKSITVFTGLSISAISTNVRVQGGGAYFLISRSLGPAYGGAIGIALYLAQALSVPFYILGFVEALVTVAPALADSFLSLCLGVAALLFAVTIIGADVAIKAQYAILAVLVASVVVFLGGSLSQWNPATFEANLQPVYTGPEYGFWVIFAIFFPAVTGIMAGVNMSGDLRDPSTSIPRGTMAAIAVGFVIYALQIVITGGAIDRATLVEQPYESLLATAMFGLEYVVVAGVFAATLSSALGSMLGAPRILQALARDHIFPVLGPFARGSAKGDEPRRGLWLTLALTVLVLEVAAVGGGDSGAALNAVAAVLTMFFLYTYGITNVAAFIEQFSRNPSFRPRFRYFHWATGLLGALGCLFAAVLINPVAALVSAGLVGAIFVYVEGRVLQTTFGDARRGYFYARVRSNLTKLSGHEPHPKNWRPTTLVLSGNPAHRYTLTSFAEWMESGRGIVSLVRVVVGEFDDVQKERTEALDQLRGYIKEKSLLAFPEVVVSPDFDTGVSVLLQTHSIGPLKPNLVVLGRPHAPERAVPFARHLRLIQALGKSMVVVVDRGLPEFSKSMRIDVWWRGRENGSLMVILAYLITLNWHWRHARIRILRAVLPDDDTTSEESEREIDALTEAARIQADMRIVEAPSFEEAIHRESFDASVVFLGFTPGPDAEAEASQRRMSRVLEGLPTTLLVSSSGDADVFA